ncbi:hypothetical protein Pmani_026670 [Petrolisthes manimaculis]|uniref:Uncharacterized protein n=1 Tax=Petrolisthes manimaculis TaxID=1843537 RepID=A0AAE1P4R6_9EUCA|nr:hypothetical protein Pmani_026670 [Petrolisthes manimaculis]
MGKKRRERDDGVERGDEDGEERGEEDGEESEGEEVWEVERKQRPTTTTIPYPPPPTTQVIRQLSIVVTVSSSSGSSRVSPITGYGRESKRSGGVGMDGMRSVVVEAHRGEVEGARERLRCGCGERERDEVRGDEEGLEHYPISAA